MLRYQESKLRWICGSNPRSEDSLHITAPIDDWASQVSQIWNKSQSYTLVNYNSTISVSFSLTPSGTKSVIVCFLWHCNEQYFRYVTVFWKWSNLDHINQWLISQATSSCYCVRISNQPRHLNLFHLVTSYDKYTLLF